MKTLWLPSLAVLLIALAFPGPIAVQGQVGIPAANVLATRESASGMVTEVVEFRRKGNTLTVQVRFRNNGTQSRTISLDYPNQKVYLLDAQGGKKYLVLYADRYIATDAPVHYQAWTREVAAGQTALVWMKFPAPPLNVKRISLVLGTAPPFEELPIQDD